MFELLATLAAGLWSGAALYIGIAEHPAALRVGVDFATRYFKHMSKRTAPLMMVLAGVGGVAGGYAWYQGSGTGWLLGASLLLAMFPLTGLLIAPTNLKLLKADTENAPDAAIALHTKWARMHWLRTLIGAPAFVIFLGLLVTPVPTNQTITLCNNTPVHLQWATTEGAGVTLRPAGSAHIELGLLNGWIDFGQLGRRYELTPGQRQILTSGRYAAAQFEVNGELRLVSEEGCPGTAAADPQPAEFPVTPVETVDLT